MITLTWSDLFPYTIANIGTHVGKRGGIYLIYVGLKNGNYRIIYVGQSQDLRARLLEHKDDSEENACLVRNREFKLAFQYCYVSEANRDDVEYTLYEKYKPECNNVTPSGKIIDITFPF